jgi:corrinoid protein of di/trimethylamine methyltransferase
MTCKLSDDLRSAVLQYNPDAARRAAEEALKANMSPMEAIRILTAAIGEVGERFHREEIFLPHVVMAADAMQAAVGVIRRSMPEEELRKAKLGKVVIGTVEGDLHDIGKNIVAMMLIAAGFEVVDLGRDVSVDEFIQRAKQENADIIALSCLMTTTLPYQREVIEELSRLKLRGRFKVIVGGGPVTREWAEKIGADGYGRDAAEAVEVAKKLLNKG